MPLPNDTILRDATLDDAAAIAEIYGESVAAGDATMDCVPWTAADVATLLLAQGDRYATLVLAQPGKEGEPDHIIGWAGIRQHNERLGYRTCCEAGIYLRRDQTGKGYGNRLVEAQLARAQKLGFHHVVARIFAENTRSIRFHEQHGFELVGVQKEIGCVNGRWIDVAILQKVFPGEAPEDPPM